MCFTVADLGTLEVGKEGNSFRNWKDRNTVLDLSLQLYNLNQNLIQKSL